MTISTPQAHNRLSFGADCVRIMTKSPDKIANLIKVANLKSIGKEISYSSIKRPDENYIVMVLNCKQPYSTWLIHIKF